MTDTDQATRLTDVAAGALNQLCPAAAMAIVLQGDPEEILQHVVEAVLTAAGVQSYTPQEADRPETTPGYTAALAAAEMEAETAYIHKLAAELTDSSTEKPANAPIEEAADHG